MDAIKDHTIAYLVKRLRDKDAVTEPVRHEAADELERLSRALELRSEEVVGALRYIEGKPFHDSMAELCAEVYQIVGSYAEFGLFPTALLDKLGAASEGKPIEGPSLLPYVVPEEVEKALQPLKKE